MRFKVFFTLAWLALPLAPAMLVLPVSPAWAVQPDEILADPKLEQRARAISGQLRCLVCQNQSIDDSEASLAKDLRVLVREHLTAGESDAQIKTFLVARYGDFILLKPPFKWDTLLLWLSPFAVLALGAAAVLTLSRQRRTEKSAAPLSEAEAAKLDELLNLEKRDEPA